MISTPLKIFLLIFISLVEQLRSFLDPKYSFSCGECVLEYFIILYRVYGWHFRVYGMTVHMYVCIKRVRETEK